MIGCSDYLRNAPFPLRWWLASSKMLEAFGEMAVRWSAHDPLMSFV